MHTPGHADPDADPVAHWEGRYGESDRMWSGNVNATTAQVAAGLPSGRALDLGCGEGGDAIWLAEQGWQVTAVDLSRTAVGRGERAAAERGIDAITWVAADLQEWEPDRPEFDLVTASFFHSQAALDRTEVLRKAASWIAPGGHLLLVSHAAPPPWSGLAHEDESHGGHVHDLPTPEQELAALDLPERDWHRVQALIVHRDATGPDGQQATLVDGVVLLRRR